ncbi:hypothetical protein FEI13_18155 [Halomonas urmiana]|uniref:Uncharacterized protein n=1 Tax=Halomonas urmiana TaxID=490901 RepID=A0A5R8M794_9GAMM|nr:hypothetical protein [Halomonas urmiana]TLF45442.1 hypothetical protein FEI13_18155 [Halomonas urmiana]
MSNFVGVVGIAVIAAGAAISTKPSAGELEIYIVDQLQTQMANLSYDNKDDSITAIMKLTCQFKPQNCAQALRALMNIQIEDYAVGQLAAIYMGNKNEPALICIGAFKNWWCNEYNSST